jgi:hypothetical protein
VSDGPVPRLPESWFVGNPVPKGLQQRYPTVLDKVFRVLDKTLSLHISHCDPLRELVALVYRDGTHIGAQIGGDGSTARIYVVPEPQDKTDLVVFVKDGCVEGVYARPGLADLRVNVCDMDGDEGEAAEEAYEAVQGSPESAWKHIA